MPSVTAEKVVDGGWAAVVADLAVGGGSAAAGAGLEVAWGWVAAVVGSAVVEGWVAGLEAEAAAEAARAAAVAATACISGGNYRVRKQGPSLDDWCIGGTIRVKRGRVLTTTTIYQACATAGALLPRCEQQPGTWVAAGVDLEAARGLEVVARERGAAVAARGWAAVVTVRAEAEGSVGGWEAGAAAEAGAAGEAAAACRTARTCCRTCCRKPKFAGQVAGVDGQQHCSPVRSSSILRPTWGTGDGVVRGALAGAGGVLGVAGAVEAMADVAKVAREKVAGEKGREGLVAARAARAWATATEAAACRERP